MAQTSVRHFHVLYFQRSHVYHIDIVLQVGCDSVILNYYLLTESQPTGAPVPVYFKIKQRLSSVELDAIVSSQANKTASTRMVGLYHQPVRLLLMLQLIRPVQVSTRTSKEGKRIIH